MPRRNNRDRKWEPKEYDNNSRDHTYDTQSKKPVRRRKGKWDKDIYRDKDE